MGQVYNVYGRGLCRQKFYWTHKEKERERERICPNIYQPRCFCILVSFFRTDVFLRFWKIQNTYGWGWHGAHHIRCVTHQFTILTRDDVKEGMKFIQEIRWQWQQPDTKKKGKKEKVKQTTNHNNGQMKCEHNTKHEQQEFSTIC